MSAHSPLHAELSSSTDTQPACCMLAHNNKPLPCLWCCCCCCCHPWTDRATPAAAAAQDVRFRLQQGGGQVSRKEQGAQMSVCVYVYML